MGKKEGSDRDTERQRNRDTELTIKIPSKARQPNYRRISLEMLFTRFVEQNNPNN